MKNRNEIKSLSWFIISIFLLGGLGYLVFYGLHILNFDMTILQKFKANYLQPLISKIFSYIVFQIFLNPYFYLPVILTFIIEILIPAEKEQKIFSIGLRQDLLWFIFGIIFHIAVIGPYVYFIKWVYDHYLSFINILIIAYLPKSIIFILAILFSDFMVWVAHFMQHKVKFFWYFHSIHHSQRELNLFTDMRFHLVDYLVLSTFAFLPMYILKLSPPSSIYYVFFTQWYVRIYHGNIKSNYGFFKYFMVTPQSHRIHHSIEPQHHDLNFGTLFSIWDNLFHTQYKHSDEYPHTGITDQSFPVEKESKGWQLFTTYWKQLIYPFQLIFRHLLTMAK